FDRWLNSRPGRQRAFVCGLSDCTDRPRMRSIGAGVAPNGAASRGMLLPLCAWPMVWVIISLAPTPLTLRPAWAGAAAAPARTARLARAELAIRLAMSVVVNIWALLAG